MNEAVSKKVFTIHEIIDFSFIIGALLGVCGTYWDIRYHVDIGRDSFWIPPHFMVYSGVTIVFLGSLLALWQARKIHKPFSKKLSFAILLILLSGLLQILGAPIDDWWHRMFGLDVTVWSPPHLLLIFAGFAISLSVIYFQKLYMHIAKLDIVRKLTSDEVKLEIMFAIALVGLNIILAEFEYFRTIPLFHPSQLRSHWLYLALLVFQFSFVFTLAKILIRNKWAVTRIATIYFLIRLGLSAILFSGGSWPIFPPMVIVSAILFDLITYRKTDFKNIVFATLIFAISFYITEMGYLYALAISRYIPRNIFEVMGSSVVSLLFSVVAYSFGKKILKQVNSVQATTQSASL